MSIVKYIFWLIAFLMGVIAAYVVPEETMSSGAKFIFIGSWGAVLGFVFYTVCKNRKRFQRSLEQAATESPAVRVGPHARRKETRSATGGHACRTSH